MNRRILKGAIDVDDKNYHVKLQDIKTGEGYRFKTKATIGTLMEKFKRYQEQGYEIEICYEATYIGFSLHRMLTKKGIKCEVIAPSLIPEVKGKAVKTDRIDAEKLAGYYIKGLLTVIFVPEKEEEDVRDILRSRTELVIKTKDIRKHIISLCRRNALNYREDILKENGNYWTKTHREWIEKQITEKAGTNFSFNLERLYETVKHLESEIDFYDAKIKQLSQTEKYQERVKALTSYRGIQTTSAMTLITEINDVRRFFHPKYLVSYAGLDIREKSSGGKEKKYGITNLGNAHIRTCLMESCQYALLPVKVSKPLQDRRSGVKEEYIQIADRCMERLHKKGIRLIFKGKHRNKVKAACAREMIGFVWETLMKAA